MGTSAAKSMLAFERMRRWPRATLRVPVEMRLNGQPHVALLHDLSEGGLRLRQESEAQVGAAVEIFVVLVPGLGPFKLRGTVMWRFGAILGVELADCGKRVRAQLRRTVAYHLGPS